VYRATLNFNYPDEEDVSMVDDLSYPIVKPAGADATRDFVGSSKARRQRVSLPGYADVELVPNPAVALMVRGLCGQSSRLHFAVSTGTAGWEQLPTNEYNLRHDRKQQHRT